MLTRRVRRLRVLQVLLVYVSSQGALALMQATSYLVTAWEALAAQQETTMEEMPVIFEDVSIVQAVQAQPGENVTLSVLLDRSHRFQVCSKLVHSAFWPCSKALLSILLLW